ncbi:unnamed protein product [Urochloa humidicola]
MPGMDGRRSFSPLLFPLLLLVLLIGCAAPCKGGQLGNSASSPPAPAPVLAPSLGFETIGFNLSRARQTGRLHGRITPKGTSGGIPTTGGSSRPHSSKPPCNSPPCSQAMGTAIANFNTNKA